MLFPLDKKDPVMDMSQSAGSNEITLERTEILPLNLRNRDALLASYMPFLKHGGIFVPTEKTYTFGQELYVLLTVQDEQQRISLEGNVVWITPKTVVSNRMAGIGIQLSNNEAGREARKKIEGILGALLNATRPTRTL